MSGLASAAKFFDAAAILPNSLIGDGTADALAPPPPSSLEDEAVSNEAEREAEDASLALLKDGAGVRVDDDVE